MAWSMYVQNHQVSGFSQMSVCTAHPLSYEKRNSYVLARCRSHTTNRKRQGKSNVVTPLWLSSVHAISLDQGGRIHTDQRPRSQRMKVFNFNSCFAKSAQCTMHDLIPLCVRAILPYNARRNYGTYREGVEGSQSH